MSLFMMVVLGFQDLTSVAKAPASPDQRGLEQQADDADDEDRDDDVLDVEVVPPSQTQKPMPTPPVSISAATITSQAVPTARRTPVSM